MKSWIVIIALLFIAVRANAQVPTVIEAPANFVNDVNNSFGPCPLLNGQQTFVIATSLGGQPTCAPLSSGSGVTGQGAISQLTVWGGATNLTGFPDCTWVDATHTFECGPSNALTGTDAYALGEGWKITGNSSAGFGFNLSTQTLSANNTVYIGSGRSGTGTPEIAITSGYVQLSAAFASTVNGLSNVTPTATFADGTHCGSGGSVAATSTTNQIQVTMGSTNPTIACPLTFGTSANCANGVSCVSPTDNKGTFVFVSSQSASGITISSYAGNMKGDTVSVLCTCF